MQQVANNLKIDNELLQRIKSIHSETSIVFKSDIDKAGRFDAEYFRPEYLKIEQKLNNIASQQLGGFLLKISGGATPLGANYPNQGIPFLRVQNIMQNYFNDNLVYISEKQNKEIQRSILEEGDVLLTITGAYGKSAVVEKRYHKANINQHSVLMRLKDGMSPYYLSTFLNSYFGKKQSDKNIVGISRPALDYQRIQENFLIPIFSDTFQLLIEDVIKMTHAKQNQSKQLYKAAEKILLQELDMLNYKAVDKLTFKTTKKEADKVERFDAEYFQPKYKKIVKAIKTYSGGWDTLGQLATIRKCVEVGSEEYQDEGIPFVRVSNLSPFELTEEKYISEKLYQEIKIHQPKKGEILFSKDATPGIAYYIDETPQKMVPSGGILRLKMKSDEVNNEYLTLVLNSILTKEQVNRDVGGSVILHWRPDQVNETVIPILPKKKRDKIQQKVQEFFKLYKQSKRLLECAKQAVEIAIEKDEKTAIKWLEKETQKI